MGRPTSSWSSGAILFIAPFAWLISASFQPIGEIFSWPPHWIPHHPTLDGYRQFLNLGHLTAPSAAEGTGDWRWFANSAFVATSVTVLQTFFNSLCAYVFAKRQFPGRNAIFMVFLATMMVPGQVTLIPNYIIAKHIPLFGGNDSLGNGGHGWLDSYWGLIMPGDGQRVRHLPAAPVHAVDPRRAARRRPDRRCERVPHLLEHRACRCASRRSRRRRSSPSRARGRTSCGR